MKEYGNHFHIEDMNIYPFNNGGFLGDAVKKANKESCIDRKIHIVRNAVQVLFNEAKERNEAKIGVVSHGKFKVFYVVFDYNGVVYYWWERYEMQIPFMSDFSSCSKLDDLEFAWDCDILSAYPEPFCVDVAVQLPDEQISTSYGIVKKDTQDKLSITDLCLEAGLILVCQNSSKYGFHLRFKKDR